MKKEVYISIGSNTPNGAVNIENAFEFIKKNFENVACSQIYSTPSVTIGDNSIYFNAVARCLSDDIDDINQELKSYEINCGRVKGSKNVVIDLDVVVADNEVLRPRDFDREYFKIGYFQLLESNI